jgi:hypothetical protein
MKHLKFMKTGLRWTNWHVRMLTDEDSLCVTWGKLHTNSGRAWQNVTLGCYSFVGVQTRLRTLIS